MHIFSLHLIENWVEMLEMKENMLKYWKRFLCLVEVSKCKMWQIVMERDFVNK